MIADALAGRRIMVTGSTGFLGTALVERLLRSVPGCDLVLLVRSGRRSTAAERIRREVLRNDAFDRLREELGDRFDDECARRITVIAGDVGTDGLGLDDEGRAALASVDVVIHSAATVAFDSPLDGAVEVNLLGPVRLAEALRTSGSNAHLVAVSTCYVAGHRRGRAPEEPLFDQPLTPNLDWRTEVAAARRLRADAEAASRTPSRLASFRRAARRELGPASTPLLSARAERSRADWVAAELVEAGRSRARSLGWPDAYAYTKALGEQALLDTRGDVPVTIVRPSIIESALAEPRPGWIRGFRMAEPVIISYARGLLREFPGVPEGVIDVIPVDLVVAAVIDAAARGPEPSPVVVQVASGTSNPLRYRRLVRLVQSWFADHPIYDAKGQPIVVPEWSFPGRSRVQDQLQRAASLLGRAERTLHVLPVRGRATDWSARLEERRSEVERALGYVELYGAYAESEAAFGVDRLLERWSTLDEADRASFCFDPRVVDWDDYVHRIHLPSVVDHARVRTSASGPAREDRGTRLRRQALSSERHLAAFDLEGTLLGAGPLTLDLWLRLRSAPRKGRLHALATTLAEAPLLARLDHDDRSDLLRYLYRRYDGLDAADLAGDSAELLAEVLLARGHPAGWRRVRAHRALGHRTVLVTGALDVAVERNLRPLFDEIICSRLAPPRDGTLTGELVGPPPTGEARAFLVRDYALSEGLRLDESVVYADSVHDLALLESVGFPVAVNPDTRLATIARKRGWLVERWGRSPGGPLALLPPEPPARRPNPHRELVR